MWSSTSLTAIIPAACLRRLSLFGKDLSPMQYALASLRHSLIIVKFSGGHAVYHQRYEHPKKWIVCGSKLWSYFLPLGDQSSPNWVHAFRSDFSLQSHFVTDDLVAFQRYSQISHHDLSSCTTAQLAIQCTPLKCIGSGLPRRYAHKRSMQIGGVQ